MKKDENREAAGHDDKLGTILWQTLDRIERSIADEQIDITEARQVIDLVTELTQALPTGSAARARLDQVRSSWIQPRTHGSRA